MTLTSKQYFRATALILVIIVIGFAALIPSSNSSKPGDALYGLDRWWEGVQLSITNGDASLAIFHLDLAAERLDELKAVEQGVVTSQLPTIITPVSAQTLNDDTITSLLEDFRFHLESATQALERMSSNEDPALTKTAQVVAITTSELSDELITLLPTLPDTVLAEVEETSSTLESLDDNSVDALISEIESEDVEDEQELSDVVLDKVTRKLERAKARVIRARQKLEENTHSVDAQIRSQFEQLIQSSEDNIAAAEQAIVDGNFRLALTFAELAKDTADTARDLVDIEDENEVESEDDQIENELENENEDVDENEIESGDDSRDSNSGSDDDRSGSNSGSDDDRSDSNSGSDDDRSGSNSGSSNDGSNDKDDEKEEDERDDDVLGIYSDYRSLLIGLMNF